MKGPYPDIIFHFTDKAAALKGIVKEQAFFPSYAREQIENLGKTKEFGCPMVSFCDLRLSELPEHMRKYGRYGIGLTKEWALSSRLNPVAYVNKSSEFTNGLIRALDWLWSEINSSSQVDVTKFTLAEHRYMDVLNMQRYIKNYEGILSRLDQKDRLYRFADEREWRYVPPHDLDGIFPFVPAQWLATKKKKKLLNDQVRPFKLPYTPQDVKYLLVPKESDIPALRKTIASLPISVGEINHLHARIITAEQVNSDF